MEESSLNSSSPTAFLTSLLQLLQTLHPGTTRIDIEVVSYCFAALLSMVDIAVIQNLHGAIFEAIKTKLLSAESSEITCKYGLLALQFLLHSKTQQQWQTTMMGTQPQCKETADAVSLLLSFLVDIKRKASQRQAIKSVCLLLRNRQIEKLSLLLV